MDLDPELMFFTWKVGVENYAANNATIVAPTGLLSSIFKDAEWQACALVQGQAHQESRAHPGGHYRTASRWVQIAVRAANRR
jgi:hypothetical protein